MDTGATEIQIAESHFTDWCRFHRAFKRYKTLKTPQRDFKTEVAVLWGAPGTGKTRRVFDSHNAKDIYVVPRGQGGQIWFDGYENHKVILIDDFYGWIKWSLMLNIMDRYPLKLPVKGGFVEFVAKYCYITSNTAWDSWYNFAENPGMCPEAFNRRVDYFEFFQ